MKALLTRHWKLKVIALLLAVASWFAIRETINFETDLPGVPLQILTGDGWAVFRQSENNVTVTFRGSQDEIRLLDRAQVKAVVDLRFGAVPGAMEVALTPQMIQGASGVRAVRLAPAAVAITLDHESEKVVPVKGRTTGKPLAGAVEEVVCEPAVVRLRGPAQQLQQTELVYTEPVDVEGRIEGFTKRRRVLPPGDSWSPQIQPPEVQVAVAIAEKTGSLEWKDVPVWMLGNPKAPLASDLTPARVTVVAMGPAEALESMKTVSPLAFVECQELDASLAYDLPVRVYLPRGHTVTLWVHPPYVRTVLEP